MTVVHNGVNHQVAVQPGPHGRDAFQAEIRRIFSLADNDSIQLTFGCKVPGTGEFDSPCSFFSCQKNARLTHRPAPRPQSHCRPRDHAGGVGYI